MDIFVLLELSVAPEKSSVNRDALLPFVFGVT
jgi:hypothetical protein